MPRVRGRLLADAALIDKLGSLPPGIIWAATGEADAIDGSDLAAEGHECVEALP